MHSGRMLRQTQNHLANIRRTHHSSPLPEGTHPRLPSPLFAFAHRPLRATPLFTQASQGHPECDIPDLGIATHPYHRLPDLFHLLLISADTTDMLDMYHALNGKQLRHLREMGIQRYVEASKAGAFGKSTRRLTEELEDRIRQWESLYSQGEPSGEREMMVYDLCVEWGAKVVFGMHEELESRGRGWDFYRASYVAKRLAWQNINVYS